jgi:YggT family protein
MLFNAGRYLAEVVFGLFSLALLLRFYLQLVRAPHRNPLSHFLNALTDFLVKPARRIIPGLWGLDLATLTLAWLCEVLLLLVLLMLYGAERGADPGAMGGVVYLAIFVLALVKLLKTSVYIVMVAVIVQALLSWFNPYSPAAPLLDSLVRPFLAPLRRRIPPIGGVDLTPLILIVILQLVLMVPIYWLETMVRVPV